MNTHADRLAQQVAIAAQRLGQLKARQMLREMRDAAQVKARTRRADVRRRLELGGAVIIADCADLTMSELIGILVDGKDRIQGSATMRLALGKRGDAWMARGKTPRQQTWERSAAPLVH
ncbi:conjugal transfer protein TraD [Pseudolysobacter antarcticus]|uniref:conjugal transfer protein TraD n=1 Tax=Pseudolysobacter antarcticus TaxID=2511995 RepID=UPI001A929C2C|nr:conjugal transfer protein TraD [Pseudolysobacter antarcticus]